MSRIELSGLVGSHPLGAMASFGLLRVISQLDSSARLSFIERDDWIAALDSGFTTGDELLQFLAEWAKSRKPEVLAAFGDGDVRVPPAVFANLLRDGLDSSALELPSFLVALAADGAKDNAKGLVKPSPFYMASGQQSFMEAMRRLLAHVRKSDVWSEALFGPWRYSASEWGAGWDPGTERMHALRFKAPTKDKTACVPGAVWLGFEALPLFPSFSVAGRVRTAGWVERDRLDHFRWLLPSDPVSVDTLTLLLASSEVSVPQGRRSGIAVIFESTRHEFGQGYAVFRPARRLA